MVVDLYRGERGGAKGLWCIIMSRHVTQHPQKNIWFLGIIIIIIGYKIRKYLYVTYLLERNMISIVTHWTYDVVITMVEFRNYHDISKVYHIVDNDTNNFDMYPKWEHKVLNTSIDLADV